MKGTSCSDHNSQPHAGRHNKEILGLVTVPPAQLCNLSLEWHCSPRSRNVSFAQDFAVSVLSTFFPHMQVNLVCTEFGKYARWTANLTTANPLLSLGTIVEGINVAGKIVFSQNLAKERPNTAWHTAYCYLASKVLTLHHQK